MEKFDFGGISGIDERSEHRAFELQEEAMRRGSIDLSGFAMHRARQKELMEKVTASLGEKPYKEHRYTVSQKPLSFYNAASLVSIRNLSSMPHIKRTYIFDGETAFQTDGSPESIYEINQKCGLSLTASNAVSYLDFFLSRIYAGAWGFALITAFKDLPGTGSFDDTLATELKRVIAKPVLRQNDTGFLITCFVLQNVTLFKADVAVSKDGTVTIPHDKTVYGELPIRRVMLR
jgi:hypothetical protein